MLQLNIFRFKLIPASLIDKIHRYDDVKMVSTINKKYPSIIIKLINRTGTSTYSEKHIQESYRTIQLNTAS